MLSLPPFFRRLPFEVRWVRCLVACFLASCFISTHLHSQWDTFDWDGAIVPDIITENKRTDNLKPDAVKISLKNYESDALGEFVLAPQKDWALNGGKNAQKGEVRLQNGDPANIYYYPYPYSEGADEFTFLAKKDSAFVDENVTYRVSLYITKGDNDPPIVSPQIAAEEINEVYHFSLKEEVDTVTQSVDILDPDISSGAIELTINYSDARYPDNQLFDLSSIGESYVQSKTFDSPSGTLYKWNLKWRNEEGIANNLPDYERLGQQKEWRLSLTYKDTGTGVEEELLVQVNLEQVWEEMLSLSDILNETVVSGSDSSDVTYDPSEDSFIVSAKESDDLNIKIPLDVWSPDLKSYQLYWKLADDWNGSAKYYSKYQEAQDWSPVEVDFMNISKGEESPNRKPVDGTANYNGNLNDESLSKPWENYDTGHALIKFTDSNFSTNPVMPVKLSLWAVPGDGEGSGGNFRIGTFHFIVEEDLSDPIYFTDEGEWMKYVTDSADGSTDKKRVVIPVRENFEWSEEFFYDDADFDFGGEEQGAKENSDIVEDPSGFFDLVPSPKENKLTLKLKSPVNFEDLLSDEYPNNQNLHVDLIIMDKDEGVTQSQNDRDVLYLKIVITGENDQPYLEESSIQIEGGGGRLHLTKIGSNDYNMTAEYPQEPEVFGFTIKENEKWEFDKNTELKLLEAMDDDFELGNDKESITWTLANEPSKGKIQVGGDSNLRNGSQIKSDPDNSALMDNLIYQADDSKTGKDSFSLRFEDNAGLGGTVTINVFIENVASAPNLKNIQVGGEKSKDEDGTSRDPIEDYPFKTTEYKILVRDGERKPIYFIFHDTDGDSIKSVSLVDPVGNPNLKFDFQPDSEEDLMLYSEDFSDYPSAATGNLDAWVKLDFVDGFYWNADSDNKHVKSASFQMLVQDSSGDQMSTQIYSFEIDTDPVDEAPDIELTTRDDIEVVGNMITVHNIKEEQKIALGNLMAKDPETKSSEPTYAYWEIKDTSPDFLDFELKTTLEDGTEVTRSELNNTNNVSIHFKKPPNLEDDSRVHEYNCTLLLKDSAESEQAPKEYTIIFKVIDVADPPRPVVDATGKNGKIAFDHVEDDEGLKYYIQRDEVPADSPEDDWGEIDLSQYFYDEDEDSTTLVFDEVTKGGYSISKSGILSFKKPPDADNQDEKEIVLTDLKIRDEKAVKWEWESGESDQSIIIQFLEKDEPPIYSLDGRGSIIPRLKMLEDKPFDQDADFSFAIEDLSISGPKKDELLKSDPNKLSNYLKDPEGTSVTIVDPSQIKITYPDYFADDNLPEEGASFELQPDDNNRFIFQAPENSPGLYVVEFAVRDTTDSVFQARFEFLVEDVSDPPVIVRSIEEPNELNPENTNPNYPNDGNVASDREIILAHEGETGPLLTLYADDKYDRGNEHVGLFNWSFENTPTASYFQFSNPNQTTSGQRTIKLEWNEKMRRYPPDYGNPPGGDGEYSYDLTIKLQEDTPNNDEITELKLQIWLISIPNEAPQFDPRDDGYILRKSEDDPDTYITRFTASDPDADDDPNYVASDIIFEVALDKKDGGRFDINETSGELSFVDFTEDWYLDYENPLDADGNGEFELLVRARKESLLNNPTEQWVTVKVENVVEPPVFESIDSSLIDANFSIDEEEEKSFSVRARSVDAVEKKVTIELDSSSEKNDNQFFEIIDTTEDSVVFAFKSPPDFENPVDLGSDNDYTVSFTAHCGGARHYENFTVRVSDVKLPLIIEDQPKENKNSLLSQVVEENNIYGFQLKIKDEENMGTNKDLLFLTSSKFGFLPHSKEGELEFAFIDSKEKSSFDSGLRFGAHIMFGDLRNVGTNDAIVFDIGSDEAQRIRYFENSDGLGAFVEDSDFWERVVDPVTSNQSVGDILNGWIPNHGEIYDIDDDGDLDLVLSAQNRSPNPIESRILVLENNYDYKDDDRINYSLLFDSNVTLTHEGTQSGNNPSFAILQPGFIPKISLSDVDGDYDLDIIAIHQSEQHSKVAWYENTTDWINNRNDLTFTFGGLVADSSQIDNSKRVKALEIFDAENAENSKSSRENKFACRDILIGTSKGIFHAYPISSAEGIKFEVEPIVEDLAIMDMKIAVSSDRNGVAYTSAQGQAYVLKDLFNRDTPQKLSTNSDYAEKIAVSYGYDRNNPSGPPAIFVSTGTSVSVFEHNKSKYSGPNKIDLGNTESVKSMAFVELNRRWAFLDYKIEDPVGIFDDQRIRGDGRLFFAQLPDFDKPLGTYNGTNSNSYEAKITVSKAHNPNISSSRNVVVRITDADEAPLFASLLPEKIDHTENMLEVIPHIEAFDPENDDFEFFIKAGEDSTAFKIDAKSGNLSFINHPNFDENMPEVDQTYQLTLGVREVDNPSQASEYSLSIQLKDGSELPFFDPVTDLDQDTNYSWSYNPEDGSVLVELTEDGTGYAFPLSLFGASDQSNIDVPPPGNNPPAGIKENSYAISTPSRWGYTWISDDNLTLHYDLKPDYNSDLNGPDELIFSVLNTAGHPAYQKIVIVVPNTPDLPRSAMPTDLLVEEEQLKVAELKGYDPDGTSVTWSLDSASAQDFEIASTNILYFKTKPDFDDLDYSSKFPSEVTLTLSSDNDNISQTIKLSIKNINDELPQSILEEKSLVTVLENLQKVVDLEVSDPDQLTDWDDLIVIIEDSPDKEHFQITSEPYDMNGEKFSRFILQTKYAEGLDFEQGDIKKIDANKDKIYDINIFVGEKLASGEIDGKNYPLKIKVIDQDETPPEITSAGGAPLMNVTVEENQFFAAQVEAKDKPEIAGSVLKYNLSDGQDINMFRINELTGTVEFRDTPNFEQPSDFDRDNFYEFEVSVSDGPHIVTQKVIVEVVDANDFPHVVVSRFEGVEDEVFEGQLAFEDEDGDVWEFVNYTFPEKNGTLELFEDYSFTYTPLKDFASVDTFSVILSDPYGQGTSQVQIAMAPVNDPPAAEDDYVFYTNLKRSNRLQFNVLANDHPGVDAPAVESYNLVSHTQTDYEQGLTSLGNGSFSYTPPAGFLGEDTFTYIVADQNDSTSRSTGTVRIWIAKTADLPDWTYLRHFGAYMETKNGWIYHEKLGWLYVEDPKGIIMSATWIWSEEIGWFWTGEKYFNWVYVDDLIGHSGKDEDRDKKWLLWQGDLTKNNNWFLKDKSDRIYSKDDFARLKIRNEILEKNLDLAGLSKFVADHEYFSRAQKVTIVTELNRYKRSSTLNEILEFDFQY